MAAPLPIFAFDSLTNIGVKACDLPYFFERQPRLTRRIADRTVLSPRCPLSVDVHF
jgi:hypothetical protein